jgi:hypothetical protein
VLASTPYAEVYAETAPVGTETVMVPEEPVPEKGMYIDGGVAGRSTDVRLSHPLNAWSPMVCAAGRSIDSRLTRFQNAKLPNIETRQDMVSGTA